MLYYVDRIDEELRKEFVPIIPFNCGAFKNTSKKHISLCPSIKDCLNCVSWNYENEILRVYVFNEEDILKENLISTEDLWKTELVLDAYMTNEVWIINQKLKPVESFCIFNVKTKEKAKMPELLDVADIEEYVKNGIVVDSDANWFDVISDVEYEIFCHETF